MIEDSYCAFDPRLWLLISGPWCIVSLSTLTLLFLFSLFIFFKKNEKAVNLCFFGWCLQPFAFVMTVFWTLTMTHRFFHVTTPLECVYEQWLDMRVNLMAHTIVQVVVMSFCLMCISFRYGCKSKLSKWYFMIILIYTLVAACIFYSLDSQLLSSIRAGVWQIGGSMN